MLWFSYAALISGPFWRKLINWYLKLGQYGAFLLAHDMHVHVHSQRRHVNLFFFQYQLFWYPRKLMLRFINLKLWPFYFFQFKTKMQIRGTFVFKHIKAHFLIKTLCLLLFGCNTYLSMYWWKIMSMTLKIRSRQLFPIDFTFFTCITKLLHINDFFI